MRSKIFGLGIMIPALLSGCSPISQEPVPGPDKQGAGTLYGAAMGAGSGIITGAQAGVAAGPAAWIGAGLGGIFGLFSGLGKDMVEEDQLRRRQEMETDRQASYAHHLLEDHYMRRLALHSNRDIFPADMFFSPECSSLNSSGQLIIKELAVLTKQRMPWSRLKIAAYSTSGDVMSPYAVKLTERRAEEIALQLVKHGIEPRRLMTQGVVVPEPIVIDPDDSPSRYRQAIEIIPLDY